MPSLCNDYDDSNGATDTEGPEYRSSSRSAFSHEEALALKVGRNAREYLESSFRTEATVLNREKFNSIPEIPKWDLIIQGHLGKGSFSDVFEVSCEGGRLLNAKAGGAGSERKPPNRKRLTRGRSHSLNEMATIGAVSPGDRLVLAMKCLRPKIRSNFDQFAIGAKDLVHETAILANLDHRHIIKLHGRAAGSITNAFALNSSYFILLDKMSESLQDRIDSWKRTEEVLKGPGMKQLEPALSIADAMSYLASKNIVFRDLKPDNVGFDRKGVLKLYDFGIAVGLPEKRKGELLYEMCGTFRYMAPEVGLSFGYGTKADVYSFGVLLWEMCAWTKPYPTVTSFDEFERYVFMGGKRPMIKEFWPKTLKEMISSCWSAAPSERPTMLDVKFSLSLEIFNFSEEIQAPPRKMRTRLKRRHSTSA